MKKLLTKIRALFQLKFFKVFLLQFTLFVSAVLARSGGSSVMIYPLGKE